MKIEDAESEARLKSRLKMAQELFREYYTTCFWYSPPDLTITPELIPFVRKGLRSYGGRKGFIDSAALRDEGARAAS